MNEVIEYVPRTQSIRATAAQFLGVPPDKACDLLRNVWQTSKGAAPLTDAEMFVGMSMIARFGLDPIAREIYVTRTSKGLVTIIGIDGWIKILDRTDGYDGFEQALEFDEKGELLWCDTAIYSTRRGHATKYRAYAAEYRKVAGVVASSLPSHMLRIFSLRHAARLFTPIGGSVVTEEEARWMDAYGNAPEPERKGLKAKLAEKVAATEYEAIAQPEAAAVAAEPVAIGTATLHGAIPEQAAKAVAGRHGGIDQDTDAEILAQWHEAIKLATLESINEYRVEAARQYADDEMPGAVHSQLMLDITQRKLALEREAAKPKRGRPPKSTAEAHANGPMPDQTSLLPDPRG